ncbi:DUF3606 domain-containing protein [Variovorax sp. JS1663]|uniref:DUF3606 domain-containing protein n=1 Tax=Variovorax sp. JS1663 TaxID=1851577 RepID=UPI000B3465D5|nr:DUF3606 domain-containing protein [Variovorax sp. JS1663]OUL98681.1 hypothetical protein A8M77_30180 [Variovorax sp. JS1663]
MPESRDFSRPESIDLGSPGAVEELAKRFDGTPQQIRDAAKTVGSRIADIEMHLKGTRSASNEQRMEDQPPSPGARP